MLRPPPPEDVPTDIGSLIRIGTIASVDHAAGRCTVKFGDPDSDDGEVESATIRWGTTRAGDISVWLPPSEGEQVMFLCPEGELAAALPIAAIFSNANPPAGTTKRALIKFEDDGVFAYDPEAHHADITLPAGATLTINADGGVTINGDVTITGTLTASEDVVADGISLKTHKHGGVQAGGAQTGQPV